MQALDRLLIIGASLESGIQLGPSRADEPGQTILGKTHVQASKPFSPLQSKRLAARDHQVLLMDSLRAGNPADSMLLYRRLKEGWMSDPKKDEVLDVLLHAGHDIALDIVEV